MRSPQRNRPLVGALVALAALFGSVSAVEADGPVDQQQAKVNQIADELDNIGNRLDQLDEDYNGALDRKAQLESDIADQQAKVAAQEAELGTLEQQLSKIAVDRFVSGGSGEISPLFTSSASYADAQQRDELSNVVLDNGSGDADKLQSLVDDLNKQRKDLEDKQHEEADLIASLDAKRTEADQLQSQYQDKLAKAKAELGDLVQQEQERRAAEAVAAAKAQMAAALQKAAADQAAKAAAANAQPTSRGGGQAPVATVRTPSGGGSSSDTPQAAAPAPQAPAYNPPPPSSRGGVAVNAAMGQIGVAYHFAAESPGVAFDCSGLTKYAWGQAGVYLPHQSAQQYASTPHVAESDAQPGDLVFYYSPISHVGLYVGGGSMVHAPRSGDVVHVVGVNWGKVVGVSRPG